MIGEILSWCLCTRGRYLLVCGSYRAEETARLFTHEIAAINHDVAKADDVQKKWLLMKETWLKGTKQVCGMTKGPPRHKETWWGNKDVGEVVAKRKVGMSQSLGEI